MVAPMSTPMGMWSDDRSGTSNTSGSVVVGNVVPGQGGMFLTSGQGGQPQYISQPQGPMGSMMMPQSTVPPFLPTNNMQQQASSFQQGGQGNNTGPMGYIGPQQQQFFSPQQPHSMLQSQHQQHQNMLSSGSTNHASHLNQQQSNMSSSNSFQRKSMTHHSSANGPLGPLSQHQYPRNSSSDMSSLLSSSDALTYSPPPNETQGNTTIFVGGLSLSLTRPVTDNDLYNIFKVHGPIHAIRILPKGCGFIVYQFHRDAEKALTVLNGAALGAITGGGQLRLSWGRNDGRPNLGKKNTGGGGINTFNKDKSNDDKSSSHSLSTGAASSSSSGSPSKTSFMSVSRAEIDRAVTLYFMTDYSDPLSTSLVNENELRHSADRERYNIEFSKIVPMSFASSARQLPEIPTILDDDFTLA